MDSETEATHTGKLYLKYKDFDPLEGSICLWHAVGRRLSEVPNSTVVNITYFIKEGPVPIVSGLKTRKRTLDMLLTASSGLQPFWLPLLLWWHEP